MMIRKALREYCQALRKHLRQLYCDHDWAAKVSGGVMGHYFVEEHCPNCMKRRVPKEKKLG
jgi:hypothetical protein